MCQISPGRLHALLQTETSRSKMKPTITCINSTCHLITCKVSSSTDFLREEGIVCIIETCGLEDVIMLGESPCCCFCHDASSHLFFIWEA